MAFLYGKQLDAVIRVVVSGPDACCAVAFLGRGISTLFPVGTKARIVCNLSVGGTNPYEVRDLLTAGHDVRQHDKIHAKIYIGARQALITSANLSANGLGLEAEEQAYWIETGFVTDKIGPIVSWFEDLWNMVDTRPITPTDLKEAEDKWRRRRSDKPKLSSFQEFDPLAADIPIIASWYDNDDYQVNKQVIWDESGLVGNEAKKFVGNSLEVHHKDDACYIRPGTWVLWWRVRKDGRPHGSQRLEWGKCGTKVSKAFRYGKGPWRDVVPTDLEARPVPFDCLDKTFLKKFKKLIASDRYSPLGTFEEGEPFYGPRMDLIRNFWIELKTSF